MLSDPQVSKYRAEVIEHTINIEWLMSSIICQHYFGRVVRPFLLEVLYDEYFSFALKRRILEKIAPQMSGQTVQNLYRINTIRNYFAHLNQEIFEGPDVPTSDDKGKVLDPRRLDRAIDFEGLYQEYTRLAGNVEQALITVYIEKGGELRRAFDR